jgi:redox-sensitive bicupin YhaK (pirin superfamily)
MRKIVFQAKGYQHGPISRMISPSDLGEFTKPFVFIDYFDAIADKNGGFGWHPHSGIATVSLVLDGGTEIEENTGFKAELSKGAVVYMQAGGRVWHTSRRDMDQRMHGFQLWVSLPPELEKSNATRHYLKNEEVVIKDNVRIILGEYQGVKSPIEAPNDMSYLQVSLKKGEQWTYKPPKTHNVLWLQVYQGELDKFKKDEVVVFDHSNESITVEALEDTSLVLGSAAKFDHDLHLGRPSVHTNYSSLVRSRSRIENQLQELIKKGVLD